MKKLCVIGGGIFGVTAALELSKFFDVTLFEKTGSILQGASTHNHLRHHYGYHYPRSKITALESIHARKSFEAEYGECVYTLFPAYYAISKQNSKTTAKEFIDFCASLNLPLMQEKLQQDLINPKKISSLFRVHEPVYNPKKLKELAEVKLKISAVKLKFNTEIIGGEIKGNKKTVKYRSRETLGEEEFDIVVSAVYVHFNDLNKWFNLPRKEILYGLVELLEIKLPLAKKFGLTIIDGEFSSVLPREGSNTFTLGHVRESVLKEVVSNDPQKDLLSFNGIPSNKENILKEGIADFPILKNAEIIGSIFVSRAVKAHVDSTDERPTEITIHGNEIYSIFGGKVITCVDTAVKLRELLLQDKSC